MCSHAVALFNRDLLRLVPLFDRSLREKTSKTGTNRKTPTKAKTHTHKRGAATAGASRVTMANDWPDDSEMVDSEDDLEENDNEEDDGGEDMNEEPAAPQPEPVEEDAAIARRRAIQSIMRDNTISDQEKRMRIQHLMSGGRTQVAPSPAPVLPQPQGAIGCSHYERNCNIVAPCCNRVYPCRICHDEQSPFGHPPMNRFLIREVICRQCGTRQATS